MILYDVIFIVEIKKVLISTVMM